MKKIPDDLGLTNLQINEKVLNIKFHLIKLRIFVIYKYIKKTWYGNIINSL